MLYAHLHHGEERQSLSCRTGLQAQEARAGAEPPGGVVLEPGSNRLQPSSRLRLFSPVTC